MELPKSTPEKIEEAKTLSGIAGGQDRNELSSKMKGVFVQSEDFREKLSIEGQRCVYLSGVRGRMHRDSL